MENSPGDRAAALGRRFAEKQANAPALLPAWPDTKRATPSAFLRSALFSAVQSKDRVWMDGVILASQEGITVRFTGKQLNQEDLTLWETLVHLAKEQPLGNVCEFTAYDILKTMGLGDGGVDRERLHEGVIRLTACAVEILVGNQKTFFSSLIDHGVKNEETGYYKIQLSKSLLKLYEQNTWVDFEQRASLKRKPLAQFLHGYYSSHKVPFAVKIETIHKLSGSKNKRMANFKILTESALKELVKIGFLESYIIDKCKVEVKKK
jgi:hypothetical protein